MNDKEYVLRSDIIRLEGRDMLCSDEDFKRLHDAFKQVLAGKMSEMDYLKFRDSIPGTTKPKN